MAVEHKTYNLFSAIYSGSAGIAARNGSGLRTGTGRVQQYISAETDQPAQPTAA
jgi:hypothetical protein